MNLKALSQWALLLLFVGGMGLSSCNDDEDTDPADTFDKEAMLTNLADNVILPEYEQLLSDAEVLLSSIKTIEAEQATEANLLSAQEAFESVQLNWQRCAPFELGPAADENLRRTLNTFPADTTQIERNIREGILDLSLAVNSDAKGLPALDYLLFGPKSGLENMSDARIQQLLINAELIQEELQLVFEQWSTAYRDEFVKNLGNDVGSSLGQLVNELNYEFELVKNARVGIPLGKKSLGVPQKEKVEAVYAQLSMECIKAAVEAQKRIFSGAEGLGLDDYLDHLDARYSDQKLSDAILEHYDQVLSDAASITGTLPDAITNDANKVETLHTSLQNLVVLIKTDMPSQLGVQITYQDNDGD